MSKQDIIICRNLKEDVEKAAEAQNYDRLFILTDEHTKTHCMPLLADMDIMKNATPICIGAEDVNKTLDTLAHVWTELSSKGATRHSLLINVGGGMVTDLGGFAAATFKRGIRYINIPTTLLSMVDAAVGGKTGINFNGLKNEIGAFAPASHVIIDCNFLKTLDMKNVVSGYAEMLKHALISSKEEWKELVSFDLTQYLNYNKLQELAGRSVFIKEKIVKQDPFEQGIRKALNLGHTIGHAFESMALKKGTPVLHGYAVAWGIVCELYLSHAKTGFPKDMLRQTVSFIKDNYGKMAFTCKDYDALYELMTHDKKNASADAVNFTLLSAAGDIKINQTATKEEILECLDFYSETMG